MMLKESALNAQTLDLVQVIRQLKSVSVMENL